MNDASGRSVRLFLVDGSPAGVITAEIVNWTGHVVVTPRSRISEALKREESGRTGVYCLVGDDPEQPNKSRVYIGEADSVEARIRMHAREKDFWSHACFITSKDMNVTKAHVRYLESRMVELTKEADRATLDNSTAPGRPVLPQSDIADMEFFLSQVQLILPVVGFDFLKPTPRVAARDSSQQNAATSQVSELSLESKKHGIEAQAVEADGELTVLSGSTAVLRGEFVTNTYAQLRVAAHQGRTVKAHLRWRAPSIPGRRDLRQSQCRSGGDIQ